MDGQLTIPVIDLADPDGTEIIRRLIKSADIAVVNPLAVLGLNVFREFFVGCLGHSQGTLCG